MNFTRVLGVVALVVLAIAYGVLLRRVGKISLTQEDSMGVVSDAINGVTEQLNRAKAEITGKIDDLTAQLDAKGSLDQADRDAIAGLKTSAQALDDIVPNAVTTPLPDPAEAPASGGTDVLEPPAPAPAAPIESDPAPTTDASATDAPAETATPTSDVETSSDGTTSAQ